MRGRRRKMHIIWKLMVICKLIFPSFLKYSPQSWESYELQQKILLRYFDCVEKLKLQINYFIFENNAFFNFIIRRFFKESFKVTELDFWLIKLNVSSVCWNIIRIFDFERSYWRFFWSKTLIDRIRTDFCMSKGGHAGGGGHHNSYSRQRRQFYRSLLNSFGLQISCTFHFYTFLEFWNKFQLNVKVNL